MLNFLNDEVIKIGIMIASFLDFLRFQKLIVVTPAARSPAPGVVAARSPWWTWALPALAWLILLMTAFLDGGGLIAAVAGVALLGTVFAAVYHAEVIAHRVGEPFGVRSVRVGRRVLQQTVARLGELDEHGCIAARALARRLIGTPEQAPLFDDGSEHLTVPVRLRLAEHELPTLARPQVQGRAQCCLRCRAAGVRGGRLEGLRYDSLRC